MAYLQHTTAAVDHLSVTHLAIDYLLVSVVVDRYRERILDWKVVREVEPYILLLEGVVSWCGRIWWEVKSSAGVDRIGESELLGDVVSMPGIRTFARNRRVPSAELCMDANYIKKFSRFHVIVLRKLRIWWRNRSTSVCVCIPL